MTFTEWRKAYPSISTQQYGATGPAIQVFSGLANAPEWLDARWDLFHLSDYVVTASVSGPSLVIVPREES